MLLSLPKAVFLAPRAATVYAVSHMEDGDSLRLRPTWFFGELGQIIRVALWAFCRTVAGRSADSLVGGLPWLPR
jgi:hypothetical protein